MKHSLTTLLRAVLTLLACASCGPQKTLPVTTLSADLEPLKTEFNKDYGKVRLILLLDPT